MAAHEAARHGTTQEIAAIRAAHERYKREQRESVADAPPSFGWGRPMRISIFSWRRRATIQH